MDIEELSSLSLQDLQAAFASKSLSPVEMMRTTLAQVKMNQPLLHALYDLREQEAMEEAKAAEARYARGGPISAFDGIPVTLKDSVHAAGMKWHHGSALHGEGVIGKIDSPPAARLRQAGAIILAKCVMPDLGLSASGVSTSHGVVRNPWGLSWNPGGSSAGAGASLAAGVGMMSVGSDIAGSVRLPAGHCGLAAIKPTQGVIPHAPASTVRSAGPLVRRAADLEAWVELLSGPDEADRYSLAFSRAGRDRPLKVGVSADFGFGPPVEPEVLQCLERAQAALEDLVGTVIPVAVQADFDACLPIDDSLKLRGWQEYSAADPERQPLAPKSLSDWFGEVEEWTPAKFKEIEAGIEKGVAFCVELLADVDVLLTPVSPVVNFPAEALGVDPKMPLRHATFTALFNQSGHPAVSLCGGFDPRGLPIGIQLVAKRHDDAALLKLAAALETRLDIFRANQKTWPTTPIA